MRKLKQRLEYWRGRWRRHSSGATFIGITGSSAKTTTAGMLAHILVSTAAVHCQILKNTLKPCLRALRTLKQHHRFAVFEMGAKGPGSLDPMIALLRPTVGVVTLVQLEHKSAFLDIESVAREKGKLIEALPPRGLAVLNHDDPRVMMMASRARVVTFGTQGGDYRIMRVDASRPGGLRLTIVYKEESFDITTALTGAHNCIAVAAAFACSHQLGVSASEIKERISTFQPLLGRCSAHAMRDGPVIIADTVKAPYHSIYLPIDMMREFVAPRKRIVIGQISDTGSSKSKYRDVYRASREVADQVIFVGPNAHRSKATPEAVAAGEFVEMQTVQELVAYLKQTAIPEEIILLKSSSNLHLERVLLGFAGEVHCWQNECGRKFDCVRCGMHAFPYARHKEILRERRSLGATKRQARQGGDLRSRDDQLGRLDVLKP